MSDEIRFNGNYEDKSTDTGFQFIFFCDRCKNGYKSKFKASAVGSTSAVLRGAGNLLGGFLSSVSNIAEDVKSSTWEKAHEEALDDAMKEISPKFIQCPKCSSWVCREKCWNTKKGLCKECAPDLGVEMAAAQSQKSVEEIYAHAAMAEEDKKLGKEYWRAGVVASCPKCETPLEKNSKFCPNCGYSLVQNDTCSKCGAKLSKTARFCADCGEPVK